MCDKSLFVCRHRATTATATATAAATSIAFAVLSLVISACVLPAYVSATNTGVGGTAVASASDEGLIAAEVQQFKTDALLRIDNFLQHKLPERVRSQGEEVRAEALQQFERCAQLATSKEEIWRFKECAAKELGGTMKQLALLVEQAYSGASTMATHAFWLRLLKLIGVF